jgi:ornithine cyclodeaminase/alanine dehydrogenase-like protein (mu-crystallin family)
MATVRTVSGALLRRQELGVRLGLINGLVSPAIALLYDLETGALLAIMSYPFGRLRTGAVMGLATRLLAREDAHALGMLGTGDNALSLLRAACHVRPIERIRVYSRSPERRARFADSAQRSLGRPVEAVPHSAAATREADIVYVATDSPTPVLRAADVAPGTFVGSMGEHSELDPSVYLAADRIVVGSKAHEQSFFRAGHVRHELLELVGGGQVSWDAVRELGDIVTSPAARRQGPGETIVFKESQGGFVDTRYASWVYERACELGRGREWDLS